MHLSLGICKKYISFFLSFQARATSALSTREGSVSALKNCWEILKCESISFVTLVTGAFPPPKVINLPHTVCKNPPENYILIFSSVLN